LSVFRRALNFFNLESWLRRRQRAIDRQILFPQIERHARGNREVYLKAVFSHVLIDQAWKVRDEWKDEDPMLYEHIISFDRVLQ
jgi:hypothetical protein